ncbi:exocyst complex component Sec15p [[Candida] jaroonii]|uniref:Exocyst complex component Sec15p n=1 Tax=[Candida] jaroonii TaxID=467808 RepID=A0ACA9YDD1_9ASCO|nr:exocyst complex component Sec15p [[Candida] jaroonii]
MAPSVSNIADTDIQDRSLKAGKTPLENLLIRDDDIFQTSLNSDDYLESLAPIIKDALKSNGLSNLINNLNDIVKNKDEELTDLSLSSTQDINSCIDSIDKIHIDSSDLNRGLQEVSTFLNKSVYELISRKKNLLKSKELNSKINETTVVLNLCIQVLEITNRIHELIKQNKYFSALKLLDELTNIHLPKVENFSFAVKIYDSIPLLRKTIKDESFDNLCKWLSTNIERKLYDIGTSVFENLYDLQDNWNSIKKKNGSTFLSHKINSPVEIAMRDPALNYNIMSDKSLNIDLSTVYYAILAYQTLNESETLSKMYHREWLKKYNRVIYPITSSVRTSTFTSNKYADSSVAEFSDIHNLDEYLKKISAFFIVDKQINLATKFELRSNKNSDDLWESYASKLKPVLIKFLETHPFNIDELNDFKDLVGNFIQTMENNEFRVTEIYDVLVILVKEYLAPELIQQFRFDFLESIQSDHYMPLVVQDKVDYDNVMRICWYREDASFAPANVRSMPISFPFSEDYVHFCLGIRSLLEDLISFIGQHYSYELNDLNNIIVEEIFEKVLGDEKNTGIAYDLQDFINKNLSNKEVISQSYTNLEYYLFSIYEIGKLVNRRLKLYNGIGTNNIDSNGTLTLKAIKHFTKLRKYAEDSIFNMVDDKVRELLDMVEYDDWYPSIANHEANFSVKDFALFLENLFTSIFASLPSSFRTLGLFRSYDFIAQHFLTTLKEAEGYNKVAIDNFDLDVRHLEDSMNALSKSENTDLNDGGGTVSLQSTFTELRQCIDLLKLDNFDDFKKNPSFRTRKFDRVKYEDGLKLISKMHIDDGDASNLSGADESFNNTSSHSVNDQQSILSSATASKFAQFGNRFKSGS